MSTLSQEMAEDALEMIREEGREITFHLEDKTRAAGSSVITEKETDEKEYCIEVKFTKEHYATGNIEIGDIRIVVPALELATVPTLKHKVIDGDETWNIVAPIERKKPADLVIVYFLHLRRAG